eukprot:gene7214-13937_t
MRYGGWAAKMKAKKEEMLAKKEEMMAKMKEMQEDKGAK